jgi:uncharacterized protein
MKNIRWVLLAFAAAVCMSTITAQTNIPKIDQRVSDFTNTLSFQEWQSLEGILKSFEDSTSTQIVVLMVNSLDGGDIEEFANKTFEVNKIGQTKKNNGVLLVIAKQDRKLRIEVGYGLEGVLTDAVSSKIIQQEIRPHFSEGNYFAGIVSGTDAIMRATAGEYTADSKGKNAPAVSSILVILILLFGFFILGPLISSRNRSIIGSNGHRYYSGWGYGGWPGSFGSKGGGFGGFGGGGFGGGGFSGGGGMSGGGGASGGW